MYITQIGKGRVVQNGDSYRLDLPPVNRERYHDAQISSYQTRLDFSFTPPLRMTVRAYTEGMIQGTAGFGFWNHPYVPGERGFRLPKAVWFFFSSPPNNMALALNVAGNGWKAATFDATRWQFFALLPTAPLGFLMMRVPALYRRLWPIGQRAIGVSEHLLDSALLTQSHDYALEWRKDGVAFAVDGVTVHETPCSPRGSLGFIAWVDNQYAVITPQGSFGFGLLDVPQAQSLIVEQIKIESLKDNI